MVSTEAIKSIVQRRNSLQLQSSGTTFKYNTIEPYNGIKLRFLSTLPGLAIIEL